MFSESRSASEAQEDRRTQPRPCISSIARFEQRDAGVYIELEAMALSREIPAALRFVATGRVSAKKILAANTLGRQGYGAVHEEVPRPALCPTLAEAWPRFCRLMAHG
jgi:hypothetical protein